MKEMLDTLALAWVEMWHSRLQSWTCCVGEEAWRMMATIA